MIDEKDRDACSLEQADVPRNSEITPKPEVIPQPSEAGESVHQQCSNKLDPLRARVREAVREGWEEVRSIAAANKHNAEYELGLRSGSNTVAMHVYRAIHGALPSIELRASDGAVANGAAATSSDPASAEAVSADVRYSVEEALLFAEYPYTERNRVHDVFAVLAAEVRRLRRHTETMGGGLRNAQRDYEALAEEVKRLRLIEARQVLVEATNEQLAVANDEQRAALRVMSTNEGRLQLRIAQLETALKD